MQAPSEIADGLHEFLSEGMLAIRTYGDAKVAALYADHLHNNPGLTADYSLDRFKYY